MNPRIPNDISATTYVIPLLSGAFGGLAAPLLKDWLSVRPLKICPPTRFSGEMVIKIDNPNNFQASIYCFGLKLSSSETSQEYLWEEMLSGPTSNNCPIRLTCANGDSPLEWTTFIGPHNTFPLKIRLNSTLTASIEVSSAKSKFALRFQSNIRRGLFQLKNRYQYHVALPTCA